MLSPTDKSTCDYFYGVLTSVEVCPNNTDHDIEKKKELYNQCAMWIDRELGIKIHMQDYTYDGKDYNKYEILRDVIDKACDRRTLLKEMNLEILEKKLLCDRNNKKIYQEIQDFILKTYNIYDIDLSPRYTDHEIIDNILIQLK